MRYLCHWILATGRNTCSYQAEAEKSIGGLKWFKLYMFRLAPARGPLYAIFTAKFMGHSAEELSVDCFIHI